MRTIWVLIFCLSIACDVHAQLCQGSLGDPVVNITFGAGQNPGPRLTTTNYQYLADDCPNDGYYTVRNKTSDCFRVSWNYLTHDHTGNPNGYFMLVNASLEKGDFYVETVKGLCPGTTYEFSAWIANMLRPYACNANGLKPNITFTIESPAGEILGRYDTGDIPDSSIGEAIWRHYGLYFTSPVGVPDVVMRMKNNQNGGCGNDLAMDDITFRPCGPSLGVSIVGVAGSTTNDCFGESNVYTFNSQISAGFNNPVYQWQSSNDGGITWGDITSQTTTQYTKPQTAQAGEYLYRIAAAEKGNLDNKSCRINSNVITVDVNPLPQINVSHQYTLCTNDTLVFAGSGGQNYSWAGPNGFSSQDSLVILPNPALSYAGTYYAHAVSAKGCITNDTVIVTIYQASVADAGNNVTICEGQATQLTGTGGVAYSWSPAAGLSSAAIYNPVATPADSTLYTLSVTDANNCVVKDSVAVNVSKLPKANAGTDKQIFEGQSVLLDATAAGTNVIYAWRPFYNISDENALQPIVSPLQDTMYTLTVTSLVGCGIATDDVFVRVYQKVRIPNAFSPNGDGINDTWNIQKLITYPEAELHVFNRSGQPMFHTKGYNKPWDGTFNGQHLPFGTYYYVIDLKNGQPKLSGWVQILY